MTRSFRILAVLAGTAILALLALRQVGVATLVEGARMVGWFTLPIIALHAVVCSLNAVAWWVSIRHLPGCPAWGTLTRVGITGFAINFLTPVVNAGGEPDRIAALTAALGGRHDPGPFLGGLALPALPQSRSRLTSDPGIFQEGHDRRKPA